MGVIMGVNLKRFVKEGCIECVNAICDECGPSRERCDWLFAQYNWHAKRCNVKEMARRPWHRQQAEWYYDRMYVMEKALRGRWVSPRSTKATSARPPR